MFVRFVYICYDSVVFSKTTHSRIYNTTQVRARKNTKIGYNDVPSKEADDDDITRKQMGTLDTLCEENNTVVATLLDNCFSLLAFGFYIHAHIILNELFSFHFSQHCRCRIPALAFFMLFDRKLTLSKKKCSVNVYKCMYV